MSELKPCPFCGGKAAINKDYPGTMDTRGRRWVYNVVCDRCCATSGLGYTSQMVKESWNRRVKDD